jgi:hypothetical protein
MPTAWTSASARIAFESISAGRSHFRAEDLLQLVALTGLSPLAADFGRLMAAWRG